MRDVLVGLAVAFVVVLCLAFAPVVEFGVCFDCEVQNGIIVSTVYPIGTSVWVRVVEY